MVELGEGFVLGESEMRVALGSLHALVFIFVLGG